MIMTMETKLILEKLDDIKSEIGFIKEHMVDVDMILTSEEEERLEESLSDLKEGRTTSLENFKKEMAKHAKDRIR